MTDNYSEPRPQHSNDTSSSSLLAPSFDRRPCSPILQDDWLQASVDRYKSVDLMLKDARKDADALASRLSEKLNPDAYNNNPLARSIASDLDEEIVHHFNKGGKSLLDSAIVELSSSSSNQTYAEEEQEVNKTWRSPADLRHPFDQKFPIGFDGQDDRLETDLDDNDNRQPCDLDSIDQDSISPAVSPTFGVNPSSGEVQLGNLLLDNQGSELSNSDDYSDKCIELVDSSMHALDTIDEASEEGDDLSSISSSSTSDHDSNKINNYNYNAGSNDTIKQTHAAYRSIIDDRFEFSHNQSRVHSVPLDNAMPLLDSDNLMIAAYSQDSIVSTETDHLSYQTACNTTPTMTSDDSYATACSDSDALSAVDDDQDLWTGTNANAFTGDETIRVRRRKSRGRQSSSSAKRRRDRNGSSSSSGSDQESTIVHSDAIVVQPKYLSSSSTAGSDKVQRWLNPPPNGSSLSNRIDGQLDNGCDEQLDDFNLQNKADAMPNTSSRRQLETSTANDYNQPDHDSHQPALDPSSATSPLHLDLDVLNDLDEFLEQAVEEKNQQDSESSAMLRRQSLSKKRLSRIEETSSQYSTISTRGADEESPDTSPSATEDSLEQVVIPKYFERSPPPPSHVQPVSPLSSLNTNQLDQTGRALAYDDVNQQLANQSRRSSTKPTSLQAKQYEPGNHGQPPVISTPPTNCSSSRHSRLRVVEIADPLLPSFTSSGHPPAPSPKSPQLPIDDDIMQSSVRKSTILTGDTEYDPKRHSPSWQAPPSADYYPTEQSNGQPASVQLLSSPQPRSNEPQCPSPSNSVQVLQAPQPSPITTSPSPTLRQPPTSPWRLKPIPSEQEIRANLRSRSRQRFFDQQQQREGRSQLPTDLSRSRQARSTSRFRSTDLDSARQEAQSKQTPFAARRDKSPSPPTAAGPTTKSYSSLLETDIDTGQVVEHRHPVVADKTRSMSNLLHAKASNSPLPNGQIANGRPEDWQKTKSLQRLYDIDNQVGLLRQRNRSDSKGLIDRLFDNAKSQYELRIAQSLTKLQVPDWLDKAECLSPTELTHKPPDLPIGPSSSRMSRRCDRYKQATPDPPTTRMSSRPHFSSARSLSMAGRRPSGTNAPGLMSTSVEMVAEPAYRKASTGSTHQPRVIRPSQIIRERGPSLTRIDPTQSKLFSSMRSLARSSTDQHQRERVGPSVIPPRSSIPNGDGQSDVLRLTPNDFVHREDRFGQSIDPARQQAMKSTKSSCVSLHHEVYDDDDDHRLYVNNAPSKSSRDRQLNDFKLADHDSGTEQSAVNVDQVKPRGKEIIRSQPVGQTSTNTYSNTFDVVSKPSQPSQHSPTPRRDESVDEAGQSDWPTIDTGGESEESEVTDGLDQISDLTCLTTLIENCSPRYRALLANRPSALDHLLTTLGWWPSAPSSDHLQTPPSPAEVISLAAHEFDLTEDSHRIDFIGQLAGPGSRGPINIGQFGPSQLSATLQRGKNDGLIYVSCGRSECPTRPTQASQVAKWPACVNCYTLYCSPQCRDSDRSIPNHHPALCSFARVKRACNRVLRNLSTSQLLGLTALAKSGVNKLGRGGILLPFALVKHAELFLDRTDLQPPAAGQKAPTYNQAIDAWTLQHLPSPNGLMSAPIYLTLTELEDLDSTVATPCKSYAPSNSMVLIVVVCAYELLARPDGRPVHLFKQALIVPFPSAASRQSSTTVPTVVTSPSDRETYASRLQRQLREHGVSLRHHYPEMYTKLANFVQTGKPFERIRLNFNDFLLKQPVLCSIDAMHDPVIIPIGAGEFNHHQHPPPPPQQHQVRFDASGAPWSRGGGNSSSAVQKIPTRSIRQ